MNGPTARRIAALLGAAIGGPLLAVAVAIGPALQHYAISRGVLPEPQAGRQDSRDQERLVAELSALNLAPLGTLPDAEVLRVADELPTGRARIPGLGIVQLRGDFARLDYQSASSAVQLNVASLLVPDIYVRAARISHEYRYAVLAENYLHNWWRSEQRSWLPLGLQWNDHAIAARVFVLTRYWVAAREAPELFRAPADWVPAAVHDSAARLAKPESFTFRTNHGLMETLALLHVAACFPQLPEARGYADLAVGRLERQLQWYLSPEGVVLEHSASYHRFGLILLHQAQRYLVALKRPELSALADGVRRAERFAAILQRPDGSIAAYGDSTRLAAAASNDHTPVATAAASDEDFFGPVSGYAVWRRAAVAAGRSRCENSHLLASWSHFAAEAHLHEDELGVLLWSGGHDWILASGYWPYDSPARAAAESWLGSNAPHFLAEPPGAPQRALALGYSHDERVALLDLQRAVQPGAMLRRQIVQLPGCVWLVVDAPNAEASSPMEVIWTFDPQVTVSAAAASASAYRLTHSNGDSALISFVGTAMPFSVSRVRAGNRLPVGWTAVDGEIAPTTSLVVVQAPGSALATVIDTSGAAIAASPAQLQWADPQHWVLHYGQTAGRIAVSRDGPRFTIDAGPQAGPFTRNLVAPSPEAAGRRAQIDARYLAMKRSSPHFNESYLPYRLKVTRAVLALGGVGAAGLLLLGALHARRRLGAVAVWLALSVTSVAWLVLAAWLQWHYFT